MSEADRSTPAREARIKRNVDQLNVVAEYARQTCSDDLFAEVIAALSGAVYA